jgi:cytochrome c-type biogenesis protein CcmE
MAQAAWEKPIAAGANSAADKAREALMSRAGRGAIRRKFLLAGGLILGVVAALIITGTLTGAQYFMTVDALLADPTLVGQSVRISGAVIGETIRVASINPDGEEITTITFTIAHIPDQFASLEQALHDAVYNPDATRLDVYYEGPRPDLLQNEAQAIMTGTLGEDGVFYASELLLKCPSRFQEGGSDPELGQTSAGGL